MSLQSRLVSSKSRLVLEKDLMSVVAIMNKIANPRKIARRILPEVSRELGFEPKLESVAKVIERYVKTVETTGRLAGYDTEALRNMFAKSHLILQSDVAVVGIKIASNIDKILTKIIQVVYSGKEKPFLNITFGHSYITVIADQCNLEKIKNVSGRKLIAYSKKNQAALSIISPKDVINVPGLGGYALTILGLSGINIVEVLSSYNEGIVVLDEKDANKSYNILREEIERIRRYTG